MKQGEMYAMVPWERHKCATDIQRTESSLPTREQSMAPWKKVSLASHCTSAVDVKNLCHDSTVWPWPTSRAAFSLFFTHMRRLSISWTLRVHFLYCLWIQSPPSGMFYPVPYFSFYFTSHLPSYLKCNFLKEAFYMPYSRSASFVINAQGLNSFPP